jgi:hypothetical protein
MGEGPVGLRHPVGFIPLFHGVPLPGRGVTDFLG